MNRRNTKNKPASPANLAPGNLADRLKTRDQAAGEQAQIRKELGQFERISIRIQRGMLYVTIALAVITAAYVSVTYSQLRVMREQSAASVESARLDERAWIGITKVSLAELHAGQQALVTVEIVNRGKTPAKNLTEKIHVGLVLPEQPIPPFDLSGAASGRSGSVLVFPNVEMKLIGSFIDEGGRDIILTPEAVKSINEGRALVYTNGRYDYRDVFNQPHWATFCFVSFAPPETPYRFTACEQGNETD